MKNKITIIIIILVTFLLTSCNKNVKTVTEIITDEYVDDIIDAYNYHNNSAYYKVTAEGTISSSLITQKLKMSKSKDEDELHYFNASYGSKLGVKINNYVEANGTYSNLNFSKGDTTSNLEKSKQTYEKDLSHTEFVNLYGVGIDEINYELNRETIKSIKKEDDIYILELDLEKSVEKYIIHINETNPFESRVEKTKFYNITLEIKLDNQKRFDKITIKETYDVETKVIRWVKQKLSAVIVEKYDYERGED